MTRRLALAALALVVLGSPAAAQQFPLKAGVTVVPDSIRVGDPFRVTVGVRAPRGATIEFPTSMDSAATVQSLDKVVVRTSADSSAVEQYADYRVAAWDVGMQPIRLPDVLVKLNGVTRRVPIADSVFVRSVLPADSAQRVPKPPRDLMVVRVIPWWLWALIAAAVAIVGLLLWWWIRRRRRPKPPVIIDPFAAAEAEFARIEALGLLDAGERARYVTLMVEVLRDYLAARYVQASLALTTTELQRSIRDLSHVPQERVIRLLTDADLIKFARRAVSTDRARELGREARAIVADEHRASQPAPDAAPAPEAAA